MGDGMLALTWNNHSTTFFKTLSTVRLKERYTDVTLSCEGRFYQLHKLVLSTCSEYFEKIFEQTPCKHPVVVLRDVSCDELEALLNYMYLGSVSVAQNDLSRLIKVAELFQIKGLAVPDEPPKTDNNSYSSRKNDSRDRSSSYRNSQSESNRTRPCASDSSDIPVPKRARTSESYSSSQTSSSASQINELSRLDDRIRSQGTIGENAGREGSGVGSSSGVQDAPFPFKIKEEVIHDIRDSDSEDPSSSGAFDALNDPDTGGSFDPLHDESQNDMIIVPKPEPEDIPPDESSVTQPGLDQESYGDDLGVPGPSDAQGWYSEGDASSGLPGAKGSIGDESQDMHSLLASQQQPQQQQAQSQQQMMDAAEHFPNTKLVAAKYHLNANPMQILGGPVGWNQFAVPVEKPYHCPHCPSSFDQKGNLNVHIRTHTGERPFSCPFCHYSSVQKITMKKHIFRKHSGIGLNFIKKHSET